MFNKKIFKFLATAFLKFLAQDHNHKFNTHKDALDYWIDKHFDTLFASYADSDTVTDLGHWAKPSRNWIDENKLDITQISKHHIVYDNHAGTIYIYCTKTKHLFKHIINVPNKNELLCRGCGETF